MSNQWIRVYFSLALLWLASPNGFAQSHTDQAPIDALIQSALKGNPELKAAQFRADAAFEALAAARAAYRPTLALEARYLRADGGRVIDFPIGDALNPAYQTLNRLTAGTSNATQFPNIANQQFTLLREREQDSRLKLSMPIYSPELDATLAANAARELDAKAASDSFARVLVRDVRRAYNSLAQLKQVATTLASSEVLLKENLRVNQALLAAGSVTRDKTLRAEAELLSLQDRLETNHNQIKAAQRYLNYLTAQPIESVDTVIAKDAALSPALIKLLDLRPTQFKNRPELQRLEAGMALATAEKARAAAKRKPSIGFGADFGIQGEDYAFGSNKNFATAAIVLNWRLIDFGQTRAQEKSAVHQQEALRAEKEALLVKLELAALQARDEAISAGRRLKSAESRSDSAVESFRITARKRDAGSATQLEFLDAERAQTEASLAVIIARFDQANQLAELELALAAYPLMLVQE
jgi:outer membrane protein